MQYATLADLSEYLVVDVGELDGRSGRLLRLASELIGYATMNRIDEDNEGHLTAARDATCAQVEYWLQSGDQVENTGPVQSYSAGSISVTYGTPAGAQGSICNRARTYLNRYGLLYRGIGRCHH